VCGCEGFFQKKKTDWNVTLNKDDKRPYGTYLAYQSLKYYFPDAQIEPVSKGFRYTNMGDKMKYNFYLSNEEWKQLLLFANNGNEIVLFCSKLDSKVEEKLKCYKITKGFEEQPLGIFNDGKRNIAALHTASDTTIKYGFEGRSIQGYFNTDVTFKERDSDESVKNATDSMVIPEPDTLGYVNGQPDFIRYKIGDGHITLHAAPLVLSNYFLLQPGNKNYLTAIWQTLPDNINRIYWNEYYKRTRDRSELGVLWRYPATRLAIILGILALLLFVLFEGKRRQRIVPVIAPIKNDSVSFVETVGRLYYNKGNHNNLSEKMVQQFLEWVRTHYYLNTNHLNETFIQQLTIKSGQPEHVVRSIIDMIHEVRMADKKIDEAYLYQLYNTMQEFYKNNPK